MTSNYDSLYAQLARFLIEHPDYIHLPHRRVVALAMEIGGLPRFGNKVLWAARKLLPEELRIEKPSNGNKTLLYSRYIIDMRHKTITYEDVDAPPKQWDMNALKYFTGDKTGVSRLLDVLIAAGYSKSSVGKGRNQDASPVIVMRKVAKP